MDAHSSSFVGTADIDAVISAEVTDSNVVGGAKAHQQACNAKFPPMAARLLSDECVGAVERTEKHSATVTTSAALACSDISQEPASQVSHKYRDHVSYLTQDQQVSEGCPITRVLYKSHNIWRLLMRYFDRNLVLGAPRLHTRETVVTWAFAEKCDL